MPALLASCGWAWRLRHNIRPDSMFMHIWDERELVMDLLEELSGNRVNYAMVTIGGARRDIDDELKAKLLKAVDKLKGPMDRIVEIALNDKTIALRTKGVGVLTKDDAMRLGAIGPHARASGVNIDVRRDSPTAPTDDFKFDIPVVHSGDVFRPRGDPRPRVLRENQNHRCRHSRTCPRPHQPRQQAAEDPKGLTVCRHEAPEGQLTQMVVGNGGFNNHRVSIHVPSFKNTPTVPYMLRENSVADAGPIIASIDPCFSCLDR